MNGENTLVSSPVAACKSMIQARTVCQTATTRLWQTKRETRSGSLPIKLLCVPNDTGGYTVRHCIWQAFAFHRTSVAEARKSEGTQNLIGACRTATSVFLRGFASATARIREHLSISIKLLAALSFSLVL